MTSDTMSLFDQPAARNSDPATSHAAAARVSPFRYTLRSRILEALVKAMTDTELCEHLGVDPRKWGSVKTARSALYGQGLVVWTGVERDRQRVWQAYEDTVDVQGGVL